MTAPASSDDVTAYVDCSDLRLGDRMALAWLAQHRRSRSGGRVALIDHCTRLASPLPLPRYFPETFADLTAEAIAARDLPRWEHGNLWLTAANAFAETQEPGRFEALPDQVERLLAAIRLLASARPRVLIHVLDDANYNFRRNWKRADVQALGAALIDAGCDVVLLNPSPSVFLGDFDRMLAEMLAADLFIGGDTGPSHVFALLRCGTPQIALYPDMARDRAAYAAEQRRLGLARPWCSLPFQTRLDVVQLSKSKRLVQAGSGWRLQSRGRFDPGRIAALALTRIGR